MDTDPPRSLAVLLRTARCRARLTQERLAERSSLSVRTIRDLESGRVRSPRLATAASLATALELSDDERADFLSAATRVPEETAPKIAPPVRVPRQLPPDTRHFTGRSAELRILKKLADNTADQQPALTISVLQGRVGVGKTALAVHLAHQLTADFPDGQLYLNLRGHDPEQLSVLPEDALGRLLRALGVDPQQIPLDIDERSALYRSALADQRVIVLLDDAAAVDQVRPLLPGSGSCLVLVTSRGRMDDLVATEGAHQLPLDVLNGSDADALLASMLGPDRVAAEPAAVATLTGLCGHLPLALRLAAANLVAQPTQSIAEAIRTMARGTSACRIRNQP